MKRKSLLKGLALVGTLAGGVALSQMDWRSDAEKFSTDNAKVYKNSLAGADSPYFDIDFKNRSYAPEPFPGVRMRDDDGSLYVRKRPDGNYDISVGFTDVIRATVYVIKNGGVIHTGEEGGVGLKPFDNKQNVSPQDLEDTIRDMLDRANKFLISHQYSSAKAVQKYDFISEMKERYSLDFLGEGCSIDVKVHQHGL